MPLILRVTNMEAGSSGSRGISWLIESSGGLSIGVSEDNGFILSDVQQTLSTHRFSIERAEGEFVLIERSGNGTSLNGGAKPLPSDLPINLTTGDIIEVGSYIVNVDAASVEDAAEGELRTVGSPEQSSLLGAVEMAPLIPVGRTTRLGGLPAEPFDEDLLPMSFLDAEQDLSSGNAGAWLVDSYPDHIPDQVGIFVQPASSVETIPEDWDLATELRITQASTVAPSLISVSKGPALGASLTSAQPAPEEPSRSMVADHTGACNEYHAAITAFLGACRLSLPDLGQADISTVMGRAGRMLLNSVVGLSSALFACERARQEPGLQCKTTARPVENPLKFMLDARDVLHAALCSDSQRTLHGDIAVEQAFADIQAHEDSLLAASRQALRSVRERLCPAAIEASVAPTRKFWGGSRKARVWEEYCRVFEDVVSDIENDTLRSFGFELGPSLRRNVGSEHEPQARTKEPAQRNG
ncbi:type VI secretion system-associated FHA domain protein TagH [Mesorhizobium silamurunense]|uniref:type VI secretion system-associated FHA domain protein TagH n=1 Tax=Mesorhizobium silamurunense TaxID=499528 RepID=UPI00177ABB8F|nr:type VI secretion system-associated FHA domain protein TagH [Mesorhizobium silamurunense]